jgi:3-carboxy-cis,cis-muconate cycloisomerase
MPATPADSALYAALFGEVETARLFTDSAEVRAMMLVEGALAKVQGGLGVIPEDSAFFIHRASMEVQIDPSGLAAETGVNGVPVPALVAAFRAGMNAPDHAQYVHWGATSQDIMDTGLVLRLRQALTLWEARLEAILARLAELAEDHADTPMVARTYGQDATPSSFGAMVASWGKPLLRHRGRLADLRARVLVVQLAGAAGTLSAMGAQGPAIRAGLAEALGLGDPLGSWHSERDRITELSGWMVGLCASLGKLGEDVLALTHSGVAEVAIAGAGASSTMPQKQNPVGASVLVALGRHAAGLGATLQGAALHREARDGAAWFTEWLTLPQLCLTLARSLATADQMMGALTPDTARMQAALDANGGLLHAEALTFALAQSMPRPEAAAAIKALCAEVRKTGQNLQDLAQVRYGDRLSKEACADLGTAPEEARAFAALVRAAKG